MQERGAVMVPLDDAGGAYTPGPGGWRIRPVVLLVVIRPRDGAVLVQRVVRRPEGVPFWRLPGGGMEFGETVEAAARREAREELGAELASVRLECVLEAFFRTERESHHELCLVHSATFADPALYERAEFRWVDGGGSEESAEWRPLAEVLAAGEKAPPRLRPRGLGAVIREVAGRMGGAAGAGTLPSGAPEQDR